MQCAWKRNAAKFLENYVARDVLRIRIVWDRIDSRIRAIHSILMQHIRALRIITSHSTPSVLLFQYRFESGREIQEFVLLPLDPLSERSLIHIHVGYAKIAVW